MQMVKLLGYAPDEDPAMPGVITSGNFYATERGIAGIRGPTNTTAALSGQQCLDAPFLAAYSQVAFSGGDLLVNFFGGSNALYSYGGGPPGVVSNVSRTSPVYTNGNQWGWDFCQVGVPVLATNWNDVLQIRPLSTGLFRNVTNPPSATPRVLASALNFAFGFCGQAEPDRWWCSALGNPDDWTPSVTTQANTGRLVGSGGGAITAALALGDQMVAYKEREIWVGTYVGSPEVWRWNRIESEGPIRHDRVCDIGGAHVFTTESGAWIFDGVRPQRIGDSRVSNSRLANRRPVYSRFRNSVHIGENVLNLSSKTWGREVPISFSGSQFQDASGDIGFLAQDGRVTGGPLSTGGSLSFTVNSFGSFERQSMARELRLLLPSNTSTGAISVVHSLDGRAMVTSGPGTAQPSATDGSGRVKIDLRGTAFWHGLNVSVNSTTGVAEVSHIGLDLKPSGRR